jgi:1-acyl-sn-glycerol-3-phosphate acyltransferase
VIAAFKNPFRVLLRSAWLAAEMLLAAARYVSLCPPGSGTADWFARAQWLQKSCRRALRVLHASVEQRGEPPAGGLLVSNHLSYLDILVISSLWPAVFVAKKEVQAWPVLGWFAVMAGTIFVDRERRSHTDEIARQIEAALNKGALVVLFPEGTSSGGHTVLPFKSSLLAPAVQSVHLLTAALIEYELEDGDVSEEVCYWKDMTLVPHLLNLLGKSCGLG